VARRTNLARVIERCLEKDSSRSLPKRGGARERALAVPLRLARACMRSGRNPCCASWIGAPARATRARCRKVAAGGARASARRRHGARGGPVAQPRRAALVSTRHGGVSLIASCCGFVAGGRCAVPRLGIGRGRVAGAVHLASEPGPCAARSHPRLRAYRRHRTTLARRTRGLAEHRHPTNATRRAEGGIREPRHAMRTRSPVAAPT
jgi:hypothetical protein